MSDLRDSSRTIIDRLRSFYNTRLTLTLTTVSAVVVMLLLMPTWFDAGGYGSGISVFLSGPFGILAGVVSWYWFFGFFAFTRWLKGDRSVKSVDRIYLLFFYVACIGSMVIAIRPGVVAPQDNMSCGCVLIEALGPGYFLYIIFITYLIFILIIDWAVRDNVVSLNAMKFLSAGLVVVGGGITIYSFLGPLSLF